MLQSDCKWNAQGSSFFQSFSTLKETWHFSMVKALWMLMHLIRTFFSLVSPKNRDPKHRSRRIGQNLFISNAFARPRINLTWRSITRHNAIALVSVHFGVLGLEKVSLVRFLSINGTHWEKDPGTVYVLAFANLLTQKWAQHVNNVASKPCRFPTCEYCSLQTCTVGCQPTAKDDFIAASKPCRLPPTGPKSAPIMQIMQPPKDLSQRIVIMDWIIMSLCKPSSMTRTSHLFRYTACLVAAGAGFNMF